MMLLLRLRNCSPHPLWPTKLHNPWHHHGLLWTHDLTRRNSPPHLLYYKPPCFSTLFLMYKLLVCEYNSSAHNNRQPASITTYFELFCVFSLFVFVSDILYNMHTFTPFFKTSSCAAAFACVGVEVVSLISPPLCLFANKLTNA